MWDDCEFLLVISRPFRARLWVVIETQGIASGSADVPVRSSVVGHYRIPRALPHFLLLHFYGSPRWGFVSDRSGPLRRMRMRASARAVAHTVISDEFYDPFSVTT